MEVIKKVLAQYLLLRLFVLEAEEGLCFQISKSFYRRIFCRHARQNL